MRGPPGGRPLLVIQPLFEEMNRCRRLLAQVTGALAERGIRSWIPDLPGTGDAERVADWDEWISTTLRVHANLGSQHSNNVAILAIRGGCLLTPTTIARYLLSPTSGASLLRDLLRSRAAADREAGLTTRLDSLSADLASGTTLDLAGYAMTSSLASALEAAAIDTSGAHVATVGDGGFPGPLVWRQGEPEDTTELAALIAADVSAWMASCASR